MKQSIEFWNAKSKILKGSLKGGINRRASLAYYLAIAQPEKFMFDRKLMTFLYQNASDKETFSLIVPILEGLFDVVPKKCISQKNLMVTVRRLAIDGHRKESERLAQILLDKNDARVCLRSVPFMEMLSCIACFDIDGTVAKMLKKLEGKEPELCEKIDLFVEARTNNEEALDARTGDRVDLVAEEEIEKAVNSAQVNQDGKLDRASTPKKLWAGPVE